MRHVDGHICIYTTVKTENQYRKVKESNREERERGLDVYSKHKRHFMRLIVKFSHNISNIQQHPIATNIKSARDLV